MKINIRILKKLFSYFIGIGMLKNIIPHQAGIQTMFM